MLSPWRAGKIAWLVHRRAIDRHDEITAADACRVSRKTVDHTLYQHADAGAIDDHHAQLGNAFRGFLDWITTGPRWIGP